MEAQYTKDLLGLNTREALVKSREASVKFFILRLEKYVAANVSTDMQQLTQAINDDFGGVNQTNDFIIEKDRILTSIKNDVLSYAHPTVWKELMRPRQNLPKTNSLVNQVPEVLTW